MATAITNSPEWSALWAFPIALAATVLIALVYFRQRREKPNAPLTYLESTWSFGESWATNVTLAAGLLTATFGSTEVVTSLVGKNGEGSAALGTVGAAVAASFVAAGSLIVLASKTKDGEHISLGGLLAASTVTLAGAAGEIWVLYRAGERLDLNGMQDLAGVVGGVAILLLVWYAARSVPAVIDNGKTAPAAAPSDVLTAGAMIVDALKAVPGTQSAELDAAVATATARHPELGAQEFESRQARRTALV
jgi:uncharacterized membrane protein